MSSRTNRLEHLTGTGCPTAGRCETGSGDTETAWDGPGWIFRPSTPRMRRNKAAGKDMTKRKPQINFQVEPAMKELYDEVSASGLRGARLCAAGLLLMVENPRQRRRAFDRLRCPSRKLRPH